MLEDIKPIPLSAGGQWDGAPSPMSATGDAKTALRRENERLLLRIAELERGLDAFATSSLHDSDVRQSEQAAREATGEYLRITKWIPDTLWSIDLSGRFTYVSPGVERAHGWRS